MFCDLADSSAIAARLDVEDFRDILIDYHTRATEIITQCGGLVARYHGDGILSYFGYPTAGESDAEHAIDAALRLINAAGELGSASCQLHLRVGIASGLVIVGDLVRSDVADRPPVVGNTAHLAARLQSVAGPDAIIIASSTRRLAAGLFDYRPLGRQMLKGFDEPIWAWEVIGRKQIESRFRALHPEYSPLFGRKLEVDALVSHWTRAKAGDGQVVLLSGEPGVGKSRLVEEVSEKLRDAARLRYFCSPDHRHSALYPIIAQLQQAARFERADTPRSKVEKLESLLSGSAALFAELMGLPPSTRYPPITMDPRRQRELLFAALVEQLERTASQSPIIVVFEDVHWADPTSLELLNIVVNRVPCLPVLLLMTFRDDFRAAWASRPKVTTMTLNRLSDHDAAMLVHSIAGDKVPVGEIVAKIVKHSDGIPLFVEELTKAFIETEVLLEYDIRPHSTDAGESLRVSANLQTLLMTRLDRLGPAKETARVCAALGREFSRELLVAVVGKAEEAVQAPLNQLVGAGLLVSRGTPPRASFSFKHTLIQDAAYNSLLRSQRRHVHARIASTLEQHFPDTAATQPEVLAHHYTEAGGLDTAIEYWLKAGQRSAARSANVEAVEQLTKGIELLKSIPASIERAQKELRLLLALGPAMQAIKGYGAPECLEIFTRSRALLDQTGTPTHRMTVLWGLWNIRYARAEMLDARAAAEDCLAAARRLGRGEALAQRVMGQTLCTMGAFVEARRCLEQAIHLASSEPTAQLRISADNHVTALTYLALTLWPLGFPEQALVAAAEGLTRARATEHALTIGIALHTHVVLETYESNHSRGATSHIDEALAHSVCYKLANFEFWCRFHKGVLIAQRGDPCRGIEMMHGVLASASSTHALQFRSRNLFHLATALASVRDYTEASEHLNSAFQSIAETGERQLEAELYRLRGDIFLSQGHHHEAEAELHRALAIARLQNAAMWELRGAVSLSRLYRKQGKTRKATDVLRPVYGQFVEGFNCPDLEAAAALLRSSPDAVRSTGV